MADHELLDVPRGLDGVVVDTTSISDVDGQAGKLSYRGVSVDKLVDQPFSQVAIRLIFGEDRSDLAATLDMEQALTVADRGLLDSVDPDLHPMHVLQGVFPLLSPTGRFDESTDVGVGLNLAAKIPEILAYHLSRERGSQPGEAQHADLNLRFLDRIICAARAAVSPVVVSINSLASCASTIPAPSRTCFLRSSDRCRLRAIV